MAVKPAGERPYGRVEAGVLQGRRQLACQSGRETEVPHRPGVRFPVDHDQHPHHLAGDAARHAREPDDRLRLGDAPDLLGDGVGRVVQRYRYERALRPALHDRLQGRDRVAVQCLEDVLGNEPACRQDQRVIGLLAPERRSVGDAGRARPRQGPRRRRADAPPARPHLRTRARPGGSPWRPLWPLRSTWLGTRSLGPGGRRMSDSEGQSGSSAALDVP